MSQPKTQISLSRQSKNGPHNLGDPNDTSLRKVEKDVVIPKKMRDKAREEKCIQEVADFSKCCKDASFFMVFKCRQENSMLKECLSKWFNDGNFKEQCTQEYLDERRRYRETGIPTKSRIQKV